MCHVPCAMRHAPSASASVERRLDRWQGVRGAPELDYVDNVPCIDLVSSLRGGLLNALDQECAAQGDAESYVARIKQAHRCLF